MIVKVVRNCGIIILKTFKECMKLVLGIFGFFTLAFVNFSFTRYSVRFRMCRSISVPSASVPTCSMIIPRGGSVPSGGSVPRGRAVQSVAESERRAPTTAPHVGG